jgi:hypothetical protein
MERKTTMMVCLLARTVAMVENRKETMIASIIIVYKLRRNNAELHTERKCALGPRLTSLPNLSRDKVLRNVEETCRRRLRG